MPNQSQAPLPNLDTLPVNAQIPMCDLETSRARNRRGYTCLSASHIRRLEAVGQFPKSRKVGGTRSVFWLAGEVREWLRQQAEQGESA